MKRNLITLILTTIALLAIFTSAAFALSPPDAPDPTPWLRPTFVRDRPLRRPGGDVPGIRRPRRRSSALFFDLGNASPREETCRGNH